MTDMLNRIADYSEANLDYVNENSMDDTLAELLMADQVNLTKVVIGYARKLEATNADQVARIVEFEKMFMPLLTKALGIPQVEATPALVPAPPPPPAPKAPNVEG